ncbi:hypothetical protein L1049_018968 [Liquidambar formosana]|uniref:DUF641 domain-containing protein n=1 Tax=Liquidambar formosana TaxID=63359 RepID=A0AAP0RAS5_LIQFO
MTDMDASSKPPQISEMFQKFALAFRTKTFEFFADDENPAAAAATADEDSDGFTLLDSAEEIITGQRVVVIKPDQTRNLSQCTLQPRPPPPPPPPPQPQQQQQQQTVAKSATQIRPTNTLIADALISSIFATVSSFEASYLQLQTAHVPFIEENIKAADRAAVSHLQKLSEFKQFYRDFPKHNPDFSIGSCLEAQVEENQSKLRTLGTVSNRLQSEIDIKDGEVLTLRQELDKIQKTNTTLSKRLSQNPNPSSSPEVLLSVKVFDSVLHEACRSIHRFTKLLINLMNKAMWDLDLAANSVHPDVDYAKKGHNRYAFLSYVCLVMFRDFSSECFGLSRNEIACNGNGSNASKNGSLRQLVEHVLCNPMEVLSRNQDCDFLRFCEKKYQELIYPMESSIFSNLDRNEIVLNSWRSLSVFYESFVNMASSIWMLHKLAFSFDPVVEIFQVERGVEFSMVYMEDVTRRAMLLGRTRAKVGFTVVPGFKIGRTVIQSQVYLTGMKCTE